VVSESDVVVAMDFGIAHAASGGAITGASLQTWSQAAHLLGIGLSDDVADGSGG